MVPLASVVLAALIGAGILAASGVNPMEAYIALLKGAFGDMASFGRTLEKATPLILSGLAVAFALKAGLFNIGTQGQLLFGALAAAFIGFSIKGVPAFIHLPLSLLAGIIAGGVYGLIQGGLKALFGAHEVITGIMLNYVAINFTDYLTNGPLMDTSFGNIIPKTPAILESSRIPYMEGIPAGFFIALGIAVIIFWFFKHTTIGFEIQAVGAGPEAARYSGIKIKYILMLTMFLSGALAGLGGAVETQGVVYRFQPGFNQGLGFEGITIALLGRTHPLGVIPAALIVGAMKSGANQMQFFADVSTEIIDVILALILFFVAADVIVAKLIPGLDKDRKKLSLSTGWGKT